MEKINYDNLDKALEVAETAPSPTLAKNHMMKRIIEAGPPKDEEDSKKLAAFLKRLWGMES